MMCPHAHVVTDIYDKMDFIGSLLEKVWWLGEHRKQFVCSSLALLTHLSDNSISKALSLILTRIVNTSVRSGFPALHLAQSHLFI